MLFALSVGVAASALIRRTIPAMAVTLVVCAAARIPIHFIRAHFAPILIHTYATPFSTVLQTRPELHRTISRRTCHPTTGCRNGRRCGTRPDAGR
jgi:hypothetical protein